MKFYFSLSSFNVHLLLLMQIITHIHLSLSLSLSHLRSKNEIPLFFISLCNVYPLSLMRIIIHIQLSLSLSLSLSVCKTRNASVIIVASLANVSNELNRNLLSLSLSFEQHKCNFLFFRLPNVTSTLSH